MLGRIARFDRELLFPVLPVAIDQFHGDRRANGLAMAHAAQDVGLVGFNLHAPAAPIAALTALEFAVHIVEIHSHARRQSLKDGNQALTM